MSEPQDPTLTLERIVAFVDDELPEAERRATAAAIAADPEAQANVLQMRRSATAAAAAYRPLLTAPLPAQLTALFAETLPAEPARTRSIPAQLRSSRVARLAVAACLSAFLLGLAGGFWLRDLNEPLRPARDEGTDAQPAQFSGVLYQALYHGHAGESFDYAAPETATTGRVIIVGELPTRSGLSCREFSHLVEHGAAPLAQHGVACRTAGGGWETITLPAPAP